MRGERETLAELGSQRLGLAAMAIKSAATRSVVGEPQDVLGFTQSALGLAVFSVPGLRTPPGHTVIVRTTVPFGSSQEDVGGIMEELKEETDAALGRLALMLSREHDGDGCEGA